MDKVSSQVVAFSYPILEKRSHQIIMKIDPVHIDYENRDETVAVLTVIIQPCLKNAHAYKV